MTSPKRVDRILTRLLKKAGATSSQPPSLERWGPFLDDIQKFLLEMEQSRIMLERSLSISSAEMRETIEKQKEISVHLAQSTKLAAIGTLASGIAHELNNPLAGILGHAELILLKENLLPEPKQRIERILNLSNRMAGIIKHLLKLSRKPTGNPIKSFSISTIIDEVMQLSKSQFTYQNINVVVDLPSHPLLVEGDFYGLTSVFQNLINNSHDEFLRMCISDGRQPTLTISYDDYRSNDQIITISITDNAGGINEDILGRIFDPFFTTKDVGEGTGLGLSLCRKILNDLGGKIWAESTGVNTTFFIQLKKSVTLESTVENSNPKISLGPLLSSADKKLKILIVDDEQDVLDILAVQLNGEFQVTTTNSPIDAIQRLDVETFDVLLTDLKMPAASGEIVISVARGVTPNIGCCVMSGHAEAVIELSSDSAFEGVLFIEKPFPSAERLTQLLHESVRVAAPKLQSA